MSLVAHAAAVAVAGGILAAGTAKVTLTAPGHSPKIGTHWNYSVSATRSGRPAKATITAQIVDPLGTVHAVQFGKTRKNIVNWPFTGTFRDFVLWPAESRGIPLTFRVTVKVGTTRKVIDYTVTARA